MTEVRLDLGSYSPCEPLPGIGRWRYERKLPLQTDGQLRVVALGIGSAFSSRMYQSNFIVIKDHTSVFVDFGTMATLRLAELGLSCHDVQHLVITHSHADHIGGLEELALRRRYEAPLLETGNGPGETPNQRLARIQEARRLGRYRPKLYVPESYARDLWDLSLRGGLAFSEEVEFLGPRGEMDLEHYFDLVPPQYDGRSTTWIVKIGPITFRSFLTMHVPDTAADSGMYTSGMVIDDRLFISGDTKFDPGIIERYGSKCETLWHDAQHSYGGIHAFYGDLKKLPTEIRSRMFLYHLSDGMVDVDVRRDGFAGLVQPAPIVYDFE